MTLRVSLVISRLKGHKGAVTHVKLLEKRYVPYYYC